MGPTTWGGKRPDIRGLEGTLATFTEMVPAVEGLYNYSNTDRGKNKQNIAFRCSSQPHHNPAVLNAITPTVQMQKQRFKGVKTIVEGESHTTLT